MRSIMGMGALAAALALSSVASVSISDQIDRRPRKPRAPRNPTPNDFGPVVDTTPESKRARRRRLAKAKS